MRCLGPAVGPTWSSSRGGSAEQYCSTPARALGLVLPPGFASGRGRKRVLVAELTEAGRSAVQDGTRLTDRQRATLERLEREGSAAVAALGNDTARRLEGRGLVALRRDARVRRPATVTRRAAPRRATPAERRARTRRSTPS